MLHQPHRLSYPEIWQNCDNKVQILLIRVFFVSRSWIVSPIFISEMVKLARCVMSKTFSPISFSWHPFEFHLKLPLPSTWTGARHKRTSFFGDVRLQLGAGNKLYSTRFACDVRETLKISRAAEIWNTLAISLIDPTKIPFISECCHEQLLVRSIAPHFKSSRTTGKLFSSQIDHLLRWIPPHPGKITVWYNLHGNCVNLITL